jgi:two-component system response regulator HydG
MSIFSRSKRVLVADDEQDTCLYLKKYLERKRLSVSVAFDGQVAKSLIDKENFDYFLLDCSMPHTTGLELIELARKKNPKSKIVLISGFSAVNEDVIRRLGGDVFLQKPLQLKEVDGIFTEAKQ